jgi:hypothetical protein
MLKRCTMLFFLLLLTGCSLGPKDNPCKDQIPIPPIPKSDVLSYLSSKIGEPEFRTSQDGKVFCAYSPAYAEKKGNQIKYYMNVSCIEVDSKLKKGAGGFSEVVLIIEQKGDRYRIISHFLPSLSNYMEDLAKIQFSEKSNCGSANSKEPVDDRADRQAMERGEEIIKQVKQYYHTQQEPTQ